MQSLSRTAWSRKALPKVLDTARPKHKENTIWPWNAWKRCCKKVDSWGEHFTGIHYRFIVNHHSQLDGQNKSAKSGTNLRKKTILINSLQRKGEGTKDNGILLWTKQAKMGPWNFDLIKEPLSWWKIVYTTNQENQLKSPRIQVNKDEYNKDKKFSPKITCPVPELINTQDGRTGLPSASSSWWYASEWSWKWAHTLFFCSDLFLLQLVSCTVDSDPL